MPQSQTNDDNSNKRPKRRAAQRTYLYHDNTSVWSEEKDLKKALLASLQEAKRSASKSTTICGENARNNSCVDENIDKTSVYSKLNTHNSSQPIVCKESPLIGENNLLSYAAHRRARVSAQRKFAQSSGSNNNSPVSTPIKIGFVPPTNVVELFPNQKPKTEDFLTFLCLRRSPILPPNLDFIRLNSSKKANEDERETDSENISCDEYEQNVNNDKYASCRLRNSDRRGSASSNVSKTTSLSSKASLQVSTSRKSSTDTQRLDTKSLNVLKRKQTQSNCSDSGLKNNKEKQSLSLPGPTLKQTHSKKTATKSTTTSEESKTKSFNRLKEKYKQQRIVKKSNIPSNIVKCVGNDSQNKKEDKNKSKQFKGIQTRQQLRNYCYDQKEVKSELKSRSNSDISERVLRSHHSGICTHSTQSLPTKLMMRNISRKKFNSSQIGIRPQKRKAKPVVPLIDYYFDSEFESDSSKRNIGDNHKKLSSTEVKSKSQKRLPEDDKSKQVFHKSLSKDKELRTPGRPKGSTKSANKAKTSLSSEPRRLTRSSRSLSPPKDSKALERERLIKQQIIEIEKKHKRLRRFPSDQSLHSSASSSSSSSSESLPNSSSSSSSINNTRLTRSLEHLKKIRDIAAKLKKEQNKNKKTKQAKNPTVDSVPKVEEKGVKRNKRQKVVKTTKDKTFRKDSKLSNKRKKSLTKNRSIARRMSGSSDTDCDTEEPDREEANNSEVMGTEDSMASMLEDDMERASIVIQDMAEEINTLLVHSGNDLEYGSTEHIPGLMTSEFSGAFSEETVTTASAMLLPSSSNSSYNYVQHMDHTTQTRSTVDASTNTTEDDILASLSSDDTQSSSKYDFVSNKLSVATQTLANSSAQTDN